MAKAATGPDHRCIGRDAVAGVALVSAAACSDKAPHERKKKRAAGRTMSGQAEAREKALITLAKPDDSQAG